VAPEKIALTMPVPKAIIRTDELISKNLDYHNGTRFLQRLKSEIQTKEVKESFENPKWENIQFIAEGKISNQELVSIDMVGDIVAVGDNKGGVGFWLGDRGLLLQPHNMKVSRASFVGSGMSTKLVSASHDGTVRILDISQQKFEMLYSWHTQSRFQHRVEWIESVNQNSWLISREGGDVLLSDVRDQSVQHLFHLSQPREFKDLMSAPIIQNISVNPLNKYLVGAFDKKMIKIYDLRKTENPISAIPIENKYNGLSSISWSPVGDPKLMTCSGDVTLQIYSMAQGDVPDVTSSWTCQFPTKNAKWCPWKQDVCFITAKRKKNVGVTQLGKPTSKQEITCSVLGLDITSESVVVDLEEGLQNQFGSLPNYEVGLHPSRTTIAVGNSSGPGSITIYGTK